MQGLWEDQLTQKLKFSIKGYHLYPWGKLYKLVLTYGQVRNNNLVQCFLLFIKRPGVIRYHKKKVQFITNTFPKVLTFMGYIRNPSHIIIQQCTNHTTSSTIHWFVVCVYGVVRNLSNAKYMCYGFTETQTQITQCKINMYNGNGQVRVSLILFKPCLHFCVF